jgi:hypothetical protein
LSRAGVGEYVDADRGLVAGCPDPTAGGVGGVLGDGSFDHAWVGATSPVGQQVGQDLAADHSDEVDDGVGDDTGGLETSSRAVLRATVRLPPSGSTSGG